ncbi:MAG TPA: helix-turn-helix domain-containing protein [Actinocrinis sp.]|uniref:DnaA N-terminal domain-containing protein n=1 Tax=Actinocrinis sp. TaxID=1920516 RepID=UPI002D54F633|nr:helix-turn-helix domain-containing protein [Actinocrinis sp.]HZU57928.1 helix-turn-helix domain-containing protein [Actinocrinis sp.]
MSRRAIAAVLARDDLSGGERLVALSLASFADRENRAWPGAPTASARAGLRRSRYQQAREQLIRRGLVEVEERVTGRGRASTVRLAFADTGPWWDGAVNAELAEAVLGYSRASGPARLLLATMAALADEAGVVRDLSTEQLCAAAGVTDRSYRRGRQALLVSGELVLVSGTGGRGNTNVWTVADPRQLADAASARLARRVPPPAGARPLVAAAAGSDGKRGQDRTVSGQKCPIRTGVSLVNGGQDRTLFELPAPETPAQTPAETPAPFARAGREPQNPGTNEDPPNPPAGGSLPDPILVEQTYVTDSGRKRQRVVRIDLAELRRGLVLPTAEDNAVWELIRAQLVGAVSESVFAVWFEPLELIAVDRAGALVIGAPDQTVSWLQKRFGRLIARCAEHVGRDLRLADEPERLALRTNEKRRAAAARRA